MTLGVEAMPAMPLDVVHHRGQEPSQGGREPNASSLANNEARGPRPPLDLGPRHDRRCRGCDSPWSRGPPPSKARWPPAPEASAREIQWCGAIPRPPWNDEGPNGAIHRPSPCAAFPRRRLFADVQTTSMGCRGPDEPPLSAGDRVAFPNHRPPSTPPGAGRWARMGGTNGQDLCVEFSHCLSREGCPFVGVEAGRDAATAGQGPCNLSTHPLGRPHHPWVGKEEAVFRWGRTGPQMGKEGLLCTEHLHCAGR